MNATATPEKVAAAGKADVSMVRMGLPDEFVTHGTREQLLAEVGLTADAVASRVIKALAGAPVP